MGVGVGRAEPEMKQKRRKRRREGGGTEQGVIPGRWWAVSVGQEGSKEMLRGDCGSPRVVLRLQEAWRLGLLGGWQGWVAER